MGISYRIEKGIVLATLEGEVGPEEIMSCLETILDDPGFVRGMNVVADNRGARTDMRFGDAVKLVERAMKIQNRFGPCKWAFLSSTPANFGISMMFSSLSDKTVIETRAFMNEKEALGWVSE